MKTKIRTLIIICTLGLVGILNANATLSYKSSGVATTLEGEKIVKPEYLNTSEFVLNENAETDYLKEAQLIIKGIADKEEAKTIQMLIDKRVSVSNEGTTSFVDEVKTENLSSAEFAFNEDANAQIDYLKEARSVTKWIADKAEAKAIQRLVDEGKLTEHN